MHTIFAGDLFIPMYTIISVGIMIIISTLFAIFLVIYRLMKHRFPSKKIFIGVAVILLLLAGVAYWDDKATSERERLYRENAGLDYID